MMGKRALDDPRNALLAEFARIVIELQPRYFIMENVSGLTSGNQRQLLDEVVEVMGEAKYQVLLPYKVLQAAEFGTPQSRKRLVLIGARRDAPLPAYPEPLFTPRRINGNLPSKVTLPLGPSVRDALGDLPDADSYEALLHDDQTVAEYGQASTYSAALRGSVREPGDYSHPRVFDPNLLTSSTRTVHTAKSIERFKETEPGTSEPISRFLRLHPDGVCNTLRAGTNSDRGAYTAPRPIHPHFPRVLTVREAARLHGYPDWFRFHVTKWNGFREIGNSVPAHLAKAVGAAILRADGLTSQPGNEILPGDPKLLHFNSTDAHNYFGLTERVIPQRDRKAVTPS